MPPPMMTVSALSKRLLMTAILSLTFAPPSTATNGRLGSSSALPMTSSSLATRKPDTAGRYAATPAVEAWARCTVPNASDTYSSAMAASALASAGSFFVSPGSKRVFSSSMISPPLSAAALALASSPTTSWAKMTGLPKSFERCSATGASVSFSRDFFHFSSVSVAGSLPFSVCFLTHLSNFASGFPRWEQAITAAPWSSRYRMVGSAATIRLSEVIAPVSLSCGTLKSQRSSTFLPLTSTSQTVLLL